MTKYNVISNSTELRNAYNISITAKQILTDGTYKRVIADYNVSTYRQCLNIINWIKNDANIDVADIDIFDQYGKFEEVTV